MNTVALVAVGFYLASLACFVGLYLSGSGYSPIKHAVSDYAVGKAAGLFQGYVWLGNFGALGLAYLFYVSAQPEFPPFIPVLLLVMVAARIGVSTFKTDLEGEKRTRQGTLHYLFATLTFALAYAVIDNATPLLTTLGTLALPNWWLAFLRFTAAVSLVGVVITVFRPLRRFFGPVERVFILSNILWFLSVSYLFVR